jgi:hypothetical protein
MGTSTGTFKVAILQGKEKAYEAEYDSEPTLETIVADMKASLEKEE